jgi:hypothetical protein
MIKFTETKFEDNIAIGSDGILIFIKNTEAKFIDIKVNDNKFAPNLQNSKIEDVVNYYLMLI